MPSLLRSAADLHTVLAVPPRHASTPRIPRLPAQAWHAHDAPPRPGTSPRVPSPAPTPVILCLLSALCTGHVFGAYLTAARHGSCAVAGAMLPSCKRTVHRLTLADADTCPWFDGALQAAVLPPQFMSTMAAETVQ